MSKSNLDRIFEEDITPTELHDSMMDQNVLDHSDIQFNTQTQSNKKTFDVKKLVPDESYKSDNFLNLKNVSLKNKDL